MITTRVEEGPPRPRYHLEWHPTVQGIPIAIYRDRTELVAMLHGTSCTMAEARKMLAALNSQEPPDAAP